MPSLAVSEMILIIAVVILGFVLLGFTTAYLLPQITFVNAENQASNLARSSTLSIGPLLINQTTNVGTTILVYNNPSVKGYVYIIAFPEPSYLQSSIGILTPSSSSISSFTVYLPNGTQAKQVTINEVYDIGGQILYDSSNQPLIAYEVPFNTPVTIKVNGVSSNDILVIWVLYNSGFWFRIGFSFTGVPS